MKTKFDKEYFLSNIIGLFRDDALMLSFIKKNEITIEDILRSELSSSKKIWFAFNSCCLTATQKQRLALNLEWSILPIFESRYIKDYRPRRCLEVVERHIKGEATNEELKEAESYANDSFLKHNADSFIASVAFAASSLAYSQILPDISECSFDSADGSYNCALLTGGSNHDKYIQTIIDFFKSN